MFRTKMGCATYENALNAFQSYWKMLCDKFNEKEFVKKNKNKLIHEKTSPLNNVNHLSLFCHDFNVLIRKQHFRSSVTRA